MSEVLGAAIGLNLLFGIPLLWGVLLTALDTLLSASAPLRAHARLGRAGLRALLVANLFANSEFDSCCACFWGF